MFNFKCESMKDAKLKGKQFRCMRLVYPMAFLRGTERSVYDGVR